MYIFIYCFVYVYVCVFMYLCVCVLICGCFNVSMEIHKHTNVEICIYVKQRMFLCICALWNYMLVYLCIEHLCVFIRLCVCLLIY